MGFNEGCLAQKKGKEKVDQPKMEVGDMKEENEGLPWEGMSMVESGKEGDLPRYVL